MLEPAFHALGKRFLYSPVGGDRIREGQIDTVGVFFRCLRIDARPVYGQVSCQMVGARQLGCEDRLCLRHRTSLIILGIFRIRDVFRIN